MDQVTSDDVVDDFELGKEEVVDIEDKEINKQKLRRRVDQYKVCSEFCAFKVLNFNTFECGFVVYVIRCKMRCMCSCF